MKRLRDNQPGFVVNAGRFSGRRYEKDTLYPDCDIPPDYKDKFMTVKPAKAAGKTATTRGGTK